MASSRSQTILFPLLLFSVLCLPSAILAASALAERQAKATEESLAGNWLGTTGQETLHLRFDPPTAFYLDEEPGRYRLEGQTLILHDSQSETAYSFTVNSGELTLSGGDLSEKLVFFRQSEMNDYTRWLVRLFSLSAVQTFARIVAICLSILLLRLALSFLKKFSLFLIFEDRGPFGLIYRKEKNRIRTLHSLVLNLMQYALYLTGLGLILGELGINTTTYLASLSVLGLAISFGSQDLVKDTVTGFFIILENQFSVDDMVEMAGRTGRVEELGLRMTRLRDSKGQSVTIPNRNISVVGRFDGGAQQAYVDVIVEPGGLKQAGELVRQVAVEVREQFPSVVLKEPHIQLPRPDLTGETFIRLTLAIWPGQQWVVEKELSPRIQQAFQQAEQPLSSERMTVFYHAAKQKTVRGS